MNDLKDLIRANFKRYRLQSKLSQVELAKLLKVRSSAVCNWENGRNPIDIDTLFKACKIFGISINQMIDEPDYVVNLDNETEVLIETFKKMPTEERQHLIKYAEWLMSQKNPSD
jgi:transcriptional regulator with XRE-family HTH domain